MPDFQGLMSVLSRLYSFKMVIIVALLLVGSLSYGLAIYSTTVHRDQSVLNQTQSLQAVIELHSREVVVKHQLQKQRFAEMLLGLEDFRDAIETADTGIMDQILEYQLLNIPDSYDYFEVSAVLVRNLEGAEIAGMRQPQAARYQGCATVLAGLGAGIIRQVEPVDALCGFEDALYSELMIPVKLDESNDPVAYLHLITNAVASFGAIGELLGTPLRITTSAGLSLYESPNWTTSTNEQFLYPQYRLYGDDSFLAAIITAAFDESAFLQQLTRANQDFMLKITGLSVIALIVLMTLLHLALRPLNRLRNSSGMMLSGRPDRIEASGMPAELSDLVDAYNGLVDELEEEAISRRQMEEKLRSEKDFIATTLNSIANPVIVVDSRGNIKLANPGAQMLLDERERDLKSRQIHDVLILYSNREATRIVDLDLMLSGRQALSSLFYVNSKRKLVELEFSASPMIDLETEDIGYVIILKDVSEDRKLRRKLSYEGSHDQLTGFLNRVAFEQKFDLIVTEQSNSVPQHVLAHFDIDQFRVVNETCGSAAGDALLKQVASSLKANVRKSDIIARLGGDEFGIIMPYFEIQHALQSLQKIIIDVQQDGFDWNGREYQITASIGVMAFGCFSDEYADFNSRITTACYLAKQNGGNQYHLVDENDRKVTEQRESMDWVSGIMKGFNEDRFCLYVQPIRAISEDNHHHYEVLIRYRSEDGDILAPGEFLPPAERYNLIEKIDRWVVGRVLDWLRDNREKNSDVVLSVNLSGRSLGSRSFHKFLYESLNDSELNLDQLVFEITETAVINNIENSVDFIESIKKLGVRFSLDDFGTGLSSFSYLKQFPVDYLKIDGEFVRDINDDDKSYVFVRSITEVGHCLDMKVIAEFVESDTMFDKLREAQVDYVQGYTIGKPVALESLETRNVPETKSAS